MTKPLLVALVVAAGSALAVTPAHAAKPRLMPNCAAKKSKTLAQSAQGRVYSIGTTAYLCGFKTNKRFALGDSEECQNQTEVGDFRFGNGVLGYTTVSCGLVSGQSTIVVRSLRTGKAKLVGSPVDQQWEGGESSGSIDNWEMKPNGSIVWVGRNSGYVTTQDGPRPPANDLVQVWKNEQGTLTKLDEGPEILPQSLALGTQSRESGEAPIYWRKGATTLSGSLR